MPATVTPIRPRKAPAAPDPDTPVVAAWLLRRGWTALDAFHAGLSAELAAAMFVLEASVPVNPMALYDALNCASTALIAAEGGQGSIAEQAFLEAAFAAPAAFPPGPLADALNLVLGAVGVMVTGCAA